MYPVAAQPARPLLAELAGDGYTLACWMDGLPPVDYSMSSPNNGAFISNSPRSSNPRRESSQPKHKTRSSSISLYPLCTCSRVSRQPYLCVYLDAQPPRRSGL